MDIVFDTVSEERAGPRWQSLFDTMWPAYRQWFLSDGIGARRTYLAGLRALKAHMPELVPTYETLVELVGGGDMEARFLSFFCPPAYLSACSQAAWPGPEPTLVRNYDYAPSHCDGVILHTKWNDRHVIGMSDCLFGLVDGMNDRGLAVSLTFGGRTVVGEGFGVPLILRYVLEFCDEVAEAVRVLERVPCHMAYNVTIVDKRGHHATVYLSPDRDALVTDSRVATNHQEKVEWHRHARATATVERERFLLQRLALRDEPVDKLIDAFLEPPLYSTAFRRGFGTIYTAVYRPRQGTAEFRWPGVIWTQRLRGVIEGKRHIRYPVAGEAVG